MFSYTAFETDDGAFRLSANKDNFKFYMPSLFIIADGKIIDEFDSISYLKNIMFKYLKDDLEFIDDETLDDLESSFSNYKEELLEMFNEADKLGFFNE